MYKYVRGLNFDTGVATVVPIIHVDLLKDAPRKEGDYKVIKYDADEVGHFYGDFSGFHLYMIVTSYRIKIVDGSLDYYDKENGLFAATLSMTLDNGEVKNIPVRDCKALLQELTDKGLVYPENITIENYSPGNSDGIKFHFPSAGAKFKFSNNMLPHIPENVRLSDSGLFDLNIEYIGKATGKDGTREVVDRFKYGHHKEAKILRELVYRRTNRDAYLILYRPGKLEKDGKEDATMSYPEVVSVLEQFLIGKFRPKGNQKGLNFPNDGSDLAVWLNKEIGVEQVKVIVRSPTDYGLLSSHEILSNRTHEFNIEIPKY